MKYNLRDILIEVLKNKKLDSEFLNNLKKDNALSLEEKGYLAFIEGLLNYWKDPNYRIFKNSLYKIVLIDKNYEKLRYLMEIRFYDDPWIVGFKKALRDAIEFLTPNTDSINYSSSKPVEKNPP
jgi:hypothetical protein